MFLDEGGKRMQLSEADKIAITKVEEQVSQIAHFLNPMHDISNTIQTN